MFKSYEVAIDGDRIHWLGDKPNTQTTKALLVIVEETNGVASNTAPKRTTPPHLVGQIKILGDIVSPIVDEEDWECLK
jgi:hypothetical protein